MNKQHYYDDYEESDKWLYKVVKIGGIDVPIYFSEMLIEEGALGYSVMAGDEVEICLNPLIQDNPAVFKQTLWHECFHMIASIYGLSDFNESIVSTLAVATIELEKTLSKDDTVAPTSKKEKKSKKNNTPSSPPTT